MKSSMRPRDLSGVVTGGARGPPEVVQEVLVDLKNAAEGPIRLI